MKVVINSCYGGFGLSEDAVRMYMTRKGLSVYIDRHPTYNVYYTHPDMTKDSYFSEYRISRADPVLVSLIEEFGSASISGKCASLRIVEIPDDIQWSIYEAEGLELIVEESRCWGCLFHRVASSDPKFESEEYIDDMSMRKYN